MKDMILLQARYNQFANNNLLKTIENVHFNALQHNVDSYFKSVIGTIEHYVSANILFFGNFFITYTDRAVCIQEIRQFIAVGGGLKDEYKKDFQSLKQVIQKTDEKIIEIVQNIHDFNTIGKIEFPQITFEKPRGELILAILNHAIHHRGEVSAILDILGISNDFAGMLGM